MYECSRRIIRDALNGGPFYRDLRCMVQLVGDYTRDVESPNGDSPEYNEEKIPL